MYLCKWADSNDSEKYLEWHTLKKVNFSFFSDENGYDDIHRFMIEKLKVGDSVDLSDGISQIHEVLRIS